MLNTKFFKIIIGFTLILQLFSPAIVLGAFNPEFIISDAELQDHTCWGLDEIQRFLDEKGSYLRNYQTEDCNGTIKTAAEIILDAANLYKINPKYILVTLQKEQSLITDDSPTAKQLDWAAGYAVCDSCAMSDPKIQKFKGFGKQVDNAAGIMRWYYDNTSHSVVKKKDTPIRIDNKIVTPGSWATAFLYTYTPHLHGNENFYRIWNTWFKQNYPDGTLMKLSGTDEYWIIQKGVKRRFSSMSSLVSRIDPRLAVNVTASELANYKEGTPISLPNYSLLRVAGNYYLLDNETIRPIETAETVRKLGFNPEETIDVSEQDIAGYIRGTIITASTTPVQGVIYQITDLNNTLFLLKDNILTPIADKSIVTINYPKLKIEKHTKKVLSQYQMNVFPDTIRDGALIKLADSNMVYVIENNRKRRIADDTTFQALGYKKSNVVTIAMSTFLNMPSGDAIYVNSSLLSSREKFLGDNGAPVTDSLKTSLPSYLVAEYPSGRILAGRDIDTARPIASITKIITAYEAVNQSFSPTKSTTYNPKLHASEGNPLSLITGEKIKNSDLLFTTLVASVNNNARMLATAAGQTEAELLDNIRTRLDEWGANNTTIQDVTGLSPDNQSSARDLLKIFTLVLKNDTIKTALSKTEYTFKEVLNKNKIGTHNLKTTNRIIDIPNRNYRVLASKTGYTDEAGATLVMLVESRATKKQFVIITLGNRDSKRFVEPDKLANVAASGKIQIANNN